MDKVYKEIFRLAIPNTVSAITVPVLGMVDMAIMGHLDSEIYLDAIALGGVIFSFIYSVFSFLRMGTAGFVAQYYGQENTAKQVITLYRVLLLALLAGVLLIVLQLPVEKISFWLLDATPAVEQNAVRYFRIRIWAAPASLGIIGITGWLAGMQNAKSPMYIALFVNVVNIAISYILVYHYGFLSAGVAWGTLIAQYAGLLLGLGLIWGKYRELFVRKINESLIYLPELKRFVQVNTDIMIRSVTLIFTFSFFTAVSSRFGETILGMNALLLQFLMFFAYFTDGFAYAAESLSGKYYGAGDKQGFAAMFRAVFRIGLVISLIFSAVYLLSGKEILSLMTDIEAVLQAAKDYIFWLSIIPLTSVAAFVLDGIFIGTLASRPMRNTLLVATFLVFLPVYFLLRDSLGNHSLWLAINLFMCTRGLMLWYYYRRDLR